MGWFSQLTSGNIGGAFESAVGNVASGVSNIGQQIDDTVNKIPGGWGTVGLATGIYFSPEIGGYVNSATGETLAQESVLAAANDVAAQQAAAASMAGGGSSLASIAGGTLADDVAAQQAAAAGMAGAGGAAAGGALSNAAAGAAGAAAGNKLADALPYIAGGSVVSGLIGADAAKSAAQAQVDAANRAAETQKYIFDTLNQQQAPYREAGYSALKDIQGQLPYLTSQYSPEDFAKGIDPGYAFRLKQGQMAAERAGNIRGMTGNVLTGLQDYTQGLASQEYANAFQRNLAQKQNIYNTLAGIAGLGQTAQGQTTTAAGNYGTNVANLMTGGAAAQAAGQIGQANALTGALNNVMNTYTLANLLGQTGKVGP